jgi:uncharacterized membrane protein
MTKEECNDVLEDERYSWKANIIYENRSDYGNETVCDCNANMSISLYSLAYLELSK